MSQRRACRLVGIHRSVARHQSQCRNNDALRERLKQLATAYPRYGYELLHGMLKAEGLVVNEKRTYRIYREEKLQVRRKRRKRLVARDRVPMPVPEKPNQRWSMDFVSDQLATGRRFRVLNVVDDYSRECIGQIVDTSITGERVSRLLDEVMRVRSWPEAIVTDNGPEFTSKAMHLWSQRSGVTLRFIQPGKPIQNALVESFNGKFRDACLNEHWFVDLSDARRTIEAWRVHYNTVRPHSSLGFLTPKQFRAAGEGGCGKAGPSGTLENSSSFPLSHSLDGGDNSLNFSLWNRT
jgi:putative transposase